MNFDFSQIGPFLIAILVLFVIYRRFRRNFGQQPLRPVRMQVRIAVLLLIGCLLLPAVLRSAAFMSAVLAGIVAGVCVGHVGRRADAVSARFESTVLRAAYLHGYRRVFLVSGSLDLPLDPSIRQCAGRPRGSRRLQTRHLLPQACCRVR